MPVARRPIGTFYQWAFVPNVMAWPCIDRTKKDTVRQPRISSTIGDSSIASLDCRATTAGAFCAIAVLRSRRYSRVDIASAVGTAETSRAGHWNSADGG